MKLYRCPPPPPQDTSGSDPIGSLAYRALIGQLCPIVGAGASAAAGLPGWSELMRSAGGDLLQIPEGHRLSDPAAVYESIDGREALEHVTNKLYENLPESWATSRGRRLLETPTGCLARLSILVAKWAPDQPFHLVTYNYDTLLEEAIAAQGHWAVAVTASNKARTWRPRDGGYRAYWSPFQCPLTIRVFHPHGILTRNDWADACGADDSHEERGRDRSDLVIGADDYDRISLEPASARSIWQLNTYGTLTCLFYGWSFEDVAVRRILRIATELQGIDRSSGQKYHFALMRRDSQLDDQLATTRELAQGVRTLFTTDWATQVSFVRHILHRAERITRKAG